MEALKPTSADEFKKLHRKVHRLPSCRCVEIRKLDPTSDFLDFQQQRERLAELKGLRPDEIMALAEKDREVFDLGVRAAEMILTRGVIRPKVYAGEISDTPDGEIHVSDLGDDAEDLVRAILSFSGVEGV